MTNGVKVSILHVSAVSDKQQHCTHILREEQIQRGRYATITWNWIRDLYNFSFLITGYVETINPYFPIFL
jgi:hypothetical protein